MEMLKNKKFLLALGGVVILALIVFFKKKKTVEPTEIPEQKEDYGNGDGGGSSYSSGQQEIKKEEKIIDNGKHDEMEKHVSDYEEKRQIASNQIYDLKDKYKQTKDIYESEGTITKDKQKILDELHNKAQDIATKYQLGESNVGAYKYLKQDTRSKDNLAPLTENVKQERIIAQKKIDSLKAQYTSAKTQQEKNKIHVEAEKTGIEAGLGAGGTTGSRRQKVDLTTGELI